MSLQELYQKRVLDHFKRPRNYCAIDAAHADEEINNPMCGDAFQFSVKIEEGIIQSIAFGGRGCAISTASCSMMTEYVQGKTVQQARELALRFIDLLSGTSCDPPGDLEDLEVFREVRHYPLRVQCARLAWDALLNVIEKKAGNS